MFGTGLKETASSNESKNQKILDKKNFDETIKNTFSYFIYQDSNYGNTLLPVIPRFPLPDEKTEVPKRNKKEEKSSVNKEEPFVIELD